MATHLKLKIAVIIALLSVISFLSWGIYNKIDPDNELKETATEKVVANIDNDGNIITNAIHKTGRYTHISLADGGLDNFYSRSMTDAEFYREADWLESLIEDDTLEDFRRIYLNKDDPQTREKTCLLLNRKLGQIKAIRNNNENIFSELRSSHEMSLTISNELKAAGLAFFTYMYYVSPRAVAINIYNHYCGGLFPEDWNPDAYSAI